MKKTIFLWMAVVLISSMTVSSEISLPYLSSSSFDTEDNGLPYIKSTTTISTTTIVSNNVFNVYFNHSIKKEIHFNLSDSDASEINTYTTGGDKFIFGGTFE